MPIPTPKSGEKEGLSPLTELKKSRNRLEFFNKYIFQWFFIRLAVVLDREKEIVIKYKILKWIIPFTGWNNDPKYIGKN